VLKSASGGRSPTGLIGFVDAVFKGVALVLRVLLIGWLIRQIARAGCGLSAGLTLGCGPILLLSLLLGPLLLVSLALQLFGLS
jgi:hypothetical protein